MEDRKDFSKLNEGEKVRLTLHVTPQIKNELKRQASSIGMSASALVSFMVDERSRR